MEGGGTYVYGAAILAHLSMGPIYKISYDLS